VSDGYIDQGTSALISVGVSTLVSYLVAKRTSRETSAHAALAVARDAVGSTIEEIALAAKRYWRADGRDPKLESEIASLFDALDLRLDVLFAHAIPIVLPEVVRARIDGLYTLSTGGTYATVGRVRDAGTVERIKVLASDLRRSLIDLSLTPKLR
jgi:hypothetical protein